MKNIKVFFYFPTLLSLVLCKKEDKTVINFAGESFFPTTNNPFLTPGTIFNYAGFGVDNEIVSFPFQKKDSFFLTGGGFYYFNLKTRSVTEVYTFGSMDSNVIYGIKNLAPNEYIAISGDRSSSKWPSYKIALINEHLKATKQNFIPDTIEKIYSIDGLNNGNYLVSYMPSGGGNMIVLFDQNLNTIHKKRAIQFNEYSQCKGRIISDKSIIQLMRPNYFTEYYQLYQHDLNGLQETKFYNSPAGYEAWRIVSSEKEIFVLGKYISVDKREILFISQFDLNCNFIETILLETNMFSNNSSYTFAFGSNILMINNSLYLSVDISLPTNNLENTLSGYLVKINPQLDIEWAKKIDNSRRIDDGYNGDDPGYLVYDGQHITCIDKSILSRVEGIKFIQTDLNGNIVK